MSGNKITKKLIIIVACIFVIAAIVTTVIIIALSHRENVGDILALGDRYMSEMDYESAIREYRHAIEIDPKSEDAYIKLSEAYIAMGDIDSAIKALEEGYEATQSERIFERLNELRRELHTPEKATKMTVATEPDKLTYFVGETLDLTGLTFTVTYDDGMTEEISEGYICDVITLEESGSVEITVTYGEIEATVNVIVYEDGKGGSGEKKPSTDPGTTEPTTTEPSTTEPTTTEPMTTEPMTTEPLTTESTTTESTTKAQEPTTAESTTTKAPETAAPEPATLTGISIKTQPAKTTYYVGDKLDLTGLTLTVSYSNGTSETIKDGYRWKANDLDKAGTATVTVEYGGFEVSFTVSVAELKAEKISVASIPERSIYCVGDILETDGMTLEVTYGNGNVETVDSGFECSPKYFSTVGKQKITVKYQGAETEFYVDVLESDDAANIRIIASSTELHPGDEFTLTVHMYNNPGIWAIRFFVSLDGDVFEYAGYSTEGCIELPYVDVQNKDGYIVSNFCMYTLENCYENGPLITLSFKVKEDAKIGTYGAKLKLDLERNTINVDSEEVAFRTHDVLLKVVD